jgi:rubredoxin
MFDAKSVIFIPPHIRCPQCNFTYFPFDILERLIIPDSTFKCLMCDYLFTLEYVGKFFGVIKNVG